MVVVASVSLQKNKAVRAERMGGEKGIASVRTITQFHHRFYSVKYQRQATAGKERTSKREQKKRRT